MGSSSAPDAAEGTGEAEAARSARGAVGMQAYRTLNGGDGILMVRLGTYEFATWFPAQA